MNIENMVKKKKTQYVIINTRYSTSDLMRNYSLSYIFHSKKFLKSSLTLF